MKVYDIITETTFRMREYPGFSWDDQTNMLTRPDGSQVRANNRNAAIRQASNWSDRTSRNRRAAIEKFKRNANSNRVTKLENVKGRLPRLGIRFLGMISGAVGRKLPWLILLEDLLDDFYAIARFHIEEEQQRAEESGEEFNTTQVTAEIAGTISAHLWDVGPVLFRDAAAFAATLWASARIAKRVINAVMWIIRGFGLSTGPGAIVVAGGTALIQFGLGWYITTDSGKQWMRDMWIWILESIFPSIIGGVAELAVTAGFETAEGIGDAAAAASEYAGDALKTRMESQAETILQGMSEFGAAPEDVPEIPADAEDDETDSGSGTATPTPAPTQSFRSIVGSGTW